MKLFSYRYLPLNFYLAYSLFVVTSLFVAPVGYKGIDYFILVAFVAAVVTLFSIGFVAGATGPLPLRHNGDVTALDPRQTAYARYRRPFLFLLVYGVVSTGIRWYSFATSEAEFSLLSLGANYAAAYEGYQRGQAKIDAYYVLNIIDQAVTTLILLFAVCYYKYVRRFGRATIWIIVASFLFVNVIGSGKMKYLGDVTVFAAFGAMINAAAVRKRFRFRTFASLAILCIAILFIFVEIMRQRLQVSAPDLLRVLENLHPLVTWDRNSAFLDLLGLEYGIALGGFLGYFTNGLYGLYLSLTLPFDWSFLVGNSYSLGRIVEIILARDGLVLEHTYPFRVGEVYGWGFTKWHSLFAWLASDFGFPGVLVLAVVFAFAYGRLWVYSIRGSNPYSGPLFVFLSLGVVFSYANNQIMHGLAGVIVLVVLVLGWLFNGSQNRRLLKRHVSAIGQNEFHGSRVVIA